MNKIGSRQLYFFLACIAPLGKLVLLPTQLVFYAGNDLLISAAINFALQAVMTFLILLLAKSNSTFYELLENTFGKITAKILICIFSLFLFYCSLLPIFEQKLFVQSVFYDTLPSTVAFSAFFLFSAYLCAKPLSSMGRTWDILAPLAIAGMVGILAFALPNADFEAIMPAGASGAKGIFSGMAYTMSWFYDSALLLMFMGKFEYKKGMAWKGLLSFLAGAAAIMFFLAVFYGVYGDIAVRQIFGFAKMGKYYAGVTVLGRIDYLFIFMLTLGMAFYCALPVQTGVTCLLQAFGSGRFKPMLFSAGANLVILILSIVLEYQFGAINDCVSETLFFLFPVFCVLVPLLALLLRRKPRAKIS